ncbi:hypothetical protein ML575_004922 [Escherichia coli]|nr:hypothetical protein [Escherichia coli]ELR5715106.1 hypothetical protein [Escherichia coli]HBB8986926.1 hypothetical protein [Escherichia coli]
MKADAPQGNDSQPRLLKQLLMANQCWTLFLDAAGLHDIKVEVATKMLNCST